MAPASERAKVDNESACRPRSTPGSPPWEPPWHQYVPAGHSRGGARSVRSRRFAATTIRHVAADAGVDASLVMQFFGSKNELFGAVLSIAPETLARLSRAFEGPEEHLGERVVRAFLAVWEGFLGSRSR
nr:TetR family transcriptional regulator [Mycolicibacterium sp. P1-18]